MTIDWNKLFTKKTVWARITLTFVTLKHFHKVAESYGVEVLEVQKLGGIIFREYRVKVRGTYGALKRLSEY